MTTRPHLPPQPPLSNEQKREIDQYAQFVQHTRQQIEAAGEAVDLRKWCVEKAIEAANRDGTIAFVIDNTGRQIDSVKVEFACVTLARDIYEFVSEPVKTALDNMKGRQV